MNTRTRWRGAAAGAVALTVALTASAPALAQDTGDVPVDPQWLANTLGRAATPAEVKNTTSPEAIARRDRATAAWKAAIAAGKRPDPRATPEYSVVWSGASR